MTRSQRSAPTVRDQNSKQPILGQEFAQVDKPAPAADGPKPQDVLLSASDKLKSHASVRASISQKVTMPQHTAIAKGSYLQGQNLQLRMEFTIELGGQKGSLLEVCDGQVLWTRHDLGEKDQSQITRRDVRQILQAAEKAEQQIKTPDEKASFQTSIISDLGIGGLPALLAAFSKDYEFKSAKPGKIDDRDVMTLEGTWTTKYREMWLGAKAKDKTPPPLPFYIPDLVRISLDKETEFPRRIEYLKLNPGESTPSPLLTLDFTKVVFNGKVNRDDFVFIPPERPAPIDITQIYLQKLQPAKKDTTPKKDTKAAPAEADKAVKTKK